MIRMVAALAFVCLYGQKVEIGQSFDLQGRIYQKDTTFRVSSTPPMRLAVKYIHSRSLLQETLWVIVRTPTGVKGRHLGLKSKRQPKEANAYITLSEPGDYFLLVYDKNRRRLAAQRFHLLSKVIAPSTKKPELVQSLPISAQTEYTPLEDTFEDLSLDDPQMQEASPPDLSDELDDL